jgi:hypothetical protein
LGFISLILCIPFLIQPIFIANAQAQGAEEKESAFWSKFRKVFSKPEPKWSKSGSQTTQTTGVRGIDEEGKLKEVYDFNSVMWMENYSVNEDAVREFLRSRGLGPYQGRASKGENK